ncbi:hypothetical protein BDV18DRAFT_30408 [Aspergillus unguis]
MADIPGLDEFAQTRGADDLFDDEIIPMTAEEQEVVLEHPPQAEPEPQTQPQSQSETQTQTQNQTQGQEVEEAQAPASRGLESSIYSDAPRSRGGERRGRGRGRGRGGRAREGKRLEEPKQKPEEATVEPVAAESEKKAEEEGQEDAASTAEAPRVPAVRGDRSATGGLKKPKLTEEELSRKIAAARENAAKIAAAHARAEADQASFEEREKVAEKKRREERANRRVMDNERERNRIRKLEALGGREWDVDKPEEQAPRGGQYRRGMHGGVSGYTRKGLGDSMYSQEEPADFQQGGRGRGRGRGGRGRGGHRGQDRPEHASEAPQKVPTPIISNEAEFPSLPGGEKKETDTKEPLDLGESKPLSPISGATWADQVEAGRD